MQILTSRGRPSPGCVDDRPQGSAPATVYQNLDPFQHCCTLAIACLQKGMYTCNARTFKVAAVLIYLLRLVLFNEDTFCIWGDHHSEDALSSE